MESKVVEIWLRKGGGSDCTFCLSSDIQVPSHHEQRGVSLAFWVRENKIILSIINDFYEDLSNA